MFTKCCHSTVFIVKIEKDVLQKFYEVPTFLVANIQGCTEAVHHSAQMLLAFVKELNVCISFLNMAKLDCAEEKAEEAGWHWEIVSILTSPFFFLLKWSRNHKIDTVSVYEWL